MSSFLFWMYPRYGGLMPTFALARELVRRGHRVTYITFPDFTDLVRKQGFPVSEICGDLFGRGFFLGSSDDSTPNPQNPLEARVEYLNRVERGDLTNTITEAGTDVILGDILCWEAAVTAVEVAKPLVWILTGLNRFPTRGIPPTNYFLMPGRNPLFGLQDLAAWAIEYARHLRRRRFEKTMRAASCELRFSKMLRHHGLPVRWGSEGLHWPDLPEAVVCPRALDFPGAQTPTRRYLGLGIDLRRSDFEMDWSDLDLSLPLVYCSMGTHSEGYPQAPAFFTAVTDLARTMPDHQFLLNVGLARNREDFHGGPRNLTVVQRAPQLQVLERASVMVTNGGLGTVKECVLNGVPMIVVPQCMDQEGNAARVVFHGLGVRAALSALGRKDARRLIAAVASDSAFRSRVQRMRDVVQREEEFHPGVDYIESFVGRSFPPR